MIGIKGFKSFLPAIPLLLIIMGESCNNIPNNTSQADPQFIQFTVKSYKVDSIVIFNEYVNSVINFHGTRSYTLEVNGKVESAGDNDSVYSRITNLNDTVLDINGSLNGAAEFKKEDILGWKTLQKYMKTMPYLNLTAEVILNQLSEEEIKFIVDTSDTIAGLPDNYKTRIIVALNELLDSLDFYRNHKAEIENEVFILYLIDSLHKDVDRLVEKGIMLDTLGTVNPNLNYYEQETLKWFNWKVFVRYCDHEAIAVDYGKVFKRYPSVGRVYAILFQQGSSRNNLNEQEILRFISLKGTGISQLAYKDQCGYIIPKKSTIYSYPFMCDTIWTTTQFFWWPDVPFINKNDFASLLYPGKAVLNYAGFSTDTNTIDSIWSYDLKIYYPLSGELVYNGKPNRIVGSIATTIRFYKVVGFQDICKYQGFFTEWNTETVIQSMDADGNISRYREKCSLKAKDNRIRR